MLFSLSPPPLSLSLFLYFVQSLLLPLSYLSIYLSTVSLSPPPSLSLSLCPKTLTNITLTQSLNNSCTLVLELLLFYIYLKNCYHLVFLTMIMSAAASRRKHGHQLEEQISKTVDDRICFSLFSSCLLMEAWCCDLAQYLPSHQKNLACS